MDKATTPKYCPHYKFFFSFRYTRMNPYVIDVYERIFVRFADVLR